MARVRVFTTTYCGYCTAAKRFLGEVKRVPFEEIDVTGDATQRHWLVSTTGRTTVPQIFIGDEAIGGYTDLRALDASGRLDAMLAAV